jgi:hypothetical protein
VESEQRLQHMIAKTEALDPQLSRLEKNINKNHVVKNMMATFGIGVGG